MINGLTWNGKHSYNDFGLLMNYKKISTPSKKKIKETVPGTSMTYDFSTVASGGEIIYNDRTIEIKFTLLATSKAQLQTRFSQVCQWLMNYEKSELKFDDMIDTYYMAEVENENTLDEINRDGEFTVIFTAEPFKYGIDTIGNNVWDTFNFEEDKLQDTNFNVVGSDTISIYNPGKYTIPTITSDSNFNVTIGGYSINVIPGDNVNYGFKFKNGENQINIIGTGNIKFTAYKELI